MKTIQEMLEEHNKELENLLIAVKDLKESNKAIQKVINSKIKKYV